MYLFEYQILSLMYIWQERQWRNKNYCLQWCLPQESTTNRWLLEGAGLKCGGRASIDQWKVCVCVCVCVCACVCLFLQSMAMFHESVKKLCVYLLQATLFWSVGMNTSTRLRTHLTSTPNFSLLRWKTVATKEWGIFMDWLTNRASYIAFGCSLCRFQSPPPPNSYKCMCRPTDT